MLSATKRLKYSKLIRPPRMWIDGHCFEIKQSDSAKLNLQDETDTLEQKTEANQHELFNITVNDHGKLFTKFQLPKAYCNALLRKSDFCSDKFQKKTNTILDISSGDETDGYISITGETFEHVAMAREEMHIWIFDIRHKISASQFISIPLLNEDVQNSFKSFKDEVLKNKDAIKHLDESVFQKPEKLHLTIVVFCLLSEAEKSEAIKELNNCKEDVLQKYLGDGTNLQIRIKGLNCMNNNLKKVDVLYAKAQFENEEDNLTLQKIADDIMNHFHLKGLCKAEKSESVKLHMTLINTKYRKNSGRRRIPIDARHIMENYKEYDFGVCEFNSIHLSLMGSVGENGFYEPLSMINL